MRTVPVIFAGGNGADIADFSVLAMNGAGERTIGCLKGGFCGNRSFSI
jgi:hypothetical protein